MSSSARNKEKHMIKNEILKTEYDKDLDHIRQGMVINSWFKYGPAKHNFGEHLVNALSTCDICIQKYKKTGNKEYLADAMNYLMFEFDYPSVQNAYYQRTDSDGSAGIEGMSYNEIKEASK